MAEDLKSKNMSISAAERKIKGYAKAHGGCTPPQVADRILREFYGLGGKAEEKPKQSSLIDLKDFL